MKRPYRIVHDTSTASSRELADWLAKDGQLLVPLVELLEKGERAIDEVIDVMGRATVEAVLQMSAEVVAGPKAQGRRGPDREVYWHGVQGGRVALKERQLRVAKPRLRKKRRRADESGEVEVPAYTALQADQRLADRMLELVLNGVSTRRYEQVLPAMADQVGISKSEVSRETIEAGTRVLQELAERDLGRTGRIGGLPRRDRVRGLPRAGRGGRRCDRPQARAGVRQANWRRMAGESPAGGRNNQPPSPRVMRRRCERQVKR